MVTQIQTTWNEYKMNWKQKELINCTVWTLKLFLQIFLMFNSWMYESQEAVQEKQLRAIQSIFSATFSLFLHWDVWLFL